MEVDTRIGEASTILRELYRLMPAQATTVAGTLLAITRQLLRLERCSNPPPVQLVFWFRLKRKIFPFWGHPWETSQVGVF